MRTAVGSDCCHSGESFGFGDLQKVAITSVSTIQKPKKKKKTNLIISKILQQTSFALGLVVQKDS